MPESDGLVVLDGYVELHVVAVDLDVEEGVFEVFGGVRSEVGFTFWVREAY